MNWYRNELPNVNDLVIATVTEINDYGVYCSLVEYNDIEAFMSFDEVSRKKRKMLNSLIKEGELIITTVLRVNKEKKHIDISKKRVSIDDIELYTNKYYTSKMFYSMLDNQIKTLNLDPQIVYEEYAWRLVDLYETGYNGLKEYIKNPEKRHETGANPELCENMYNIACIKFIKNEYTIITYLEIVCFTGYGIDAIKETLIEGKKFGVDIKNYTAPYYIMTVITENKDDGKKLIDECVNKMKAIIKTHGGELNVVDKPVLEKEKIEVA